MENQEYIVKQPYIKVIREVGSVGKIEYADHRELYLYPDKLVSAYHTFSIDEVLDLSFKDIKGEGGLLFVHTDHGVYSYTLESSPEQLLKSFEKVKDTA